MLRKEFLQKTSLMLGGSLLANANVFAKNNTETYTVQQVINRILQEIPGAPFEKTVDQLRSGSPTQVVTGIVTTMFPTLAVIEKTAALGANLIIAHETPFYNNEDQTDWLKDDPAFNHKIQLLQKHGIAIWRFHDYWHRHKPDGIIMGNLIKLGWQAYYNPDEQRIIKLPTAISTKAVYQHVKKKLGIDSVRLVGNPNKMVQTFYLAFGYHGSQQQIANINKLKPDMILSGETREWETVERVRDGLHMGQNTSLLVLSHSVSEEAGMEYAVTWLQPKLPGANITHLPSGNPFLFK
jgi:putative NIF3 family GTP cyclohydrolase 1 type 2